MNDLALSDESNRQAFTIPLGARVVVRLGENPTTGYRWSLRSPVDPVLKLESDDYALTPTQAIGAGGTRIFQFVGHRPGAKTILLKLMREWEPENQAVSEFSAAITVTT